MKKFRDPVELSSALISQRKALASSSHAFDAGELWEAQRLATTVYVLVHDGGRNYKSLLTQMGFKSGMKFLASGRKINLKNMALPDTPLVQMRVSFQKPDNSTYQARFADVPENHRWVSFGEWWERDLIFRGREDPFTLTRKSLVFSLRSQEGGAHYDEAITDANYIEMLHGKTWTIKVGEEVLYTFRNLESMSMRQIAWELEQSLNVAGL